MGKSSLNWNFTSFYIPILDRHSPPPPTSLPSNGNTFRFRTVSLKYITKCWRYSPQYLYNKCANRSLKLVNNYYTRYLRKTAHLLGTFINKTIGYKRMKFSQHERYFQTVHLALFIMQLHPNKNYLVALLVDAITNVL